MIRQRGQLGLIILSIGILGLASAGAAAFQGTPPHTFYGTARLNGSPAAPGTEISATIGETLCGTTRTDTSAGYVLDVPTTGEKPGCGADGLVIHFAVAGAPVQQTATFKSGEITQLDLSADADGQPTPPAPTGTPPASPTASATPATTPTATQRPPHTPTEVPVATPSRTATVQATVPPQGRDLYLPMVLRMSPANGPTPAQLRATPWRIPHRCCIPL